VNKGIHSTLWKKMFTKMAIPVIPPEREHPANILRVYFLSDILKIRHEIFFKKTGAAPIVQN
jgi:hypothetical protein